MATINGRVYEVGTHVIDGNIIQVIDKNTYKTIGKAEAPAPEKEPEGRININTADAEVLEELEGVGKAAARRIVKARPFDSVDDLVRVKGVSEKTVDNNRDRITA